MFLRIFIFILFATQLLSANAAGENPAGARRIGMGGGYSALRGDVWSLWANPASLSGIIQAEGGLYAKSSYLVNTLNTASFGAALPFKEVHHAGISLSTFGFDSYRENNIGLTYAATLYDILHLGVKVNVLNLAIAQYGATSTFFVNPGLTADISPKFSVGFWVQNANQARIGSVREERLPTQLSGGLCYKPSSKIVVTADAVKPLDYALGINAGFEYYFINQFCIRAGYTTYPSQLAAGVGFKLPNLSIDFANTYHERLGYSPHLSVSVRLGKSKTGAAPNLGSPKPTPPAPVVKPSPTPSKPTPTPSSTPKSGTITPKPAPGVKPQPLTPEKSGTKTPTPSGKPSDTVAPSKTPQNSTSGKPATPPPTEKKSGNKSPQ